MKLYCTFTSFENINLTFNLINNKLSVDKIDVYKIISNNDIKYGLIYSTDEYVIKIIPNTIIFHKNKFDVFYTLNALNILIKKHNKNIPGKKTIIPWSRYSNSIILNDNNRLNFYKTEFYKSLALV